MSPTSLSSRGRIVVIMECIKLKMLLPSFLLTSQFIQYFNGGYKAHTNTHKHTRTESMVITQIYIVPLKEEQCAKSCH